MLKSRVSGMMMGLSFAAVIAGCTSSKEPFLNRAQRPEELCIGNAVLVQQESPQEAFKQSQVLRYVVKRGDTLWDISQHFLIKPWYWKELWYDNPQVRNPHRIYPGDVLSVVTLNGDKRITITEANPEYHGMDTGRTTKDGRSIYKYRPGVREYAIGQEPITIANKTIAPFLLNAEVMTAEQIKRAPKVYGDAGDYLSLTNQQMIYAQDIPANYQEFKIYRAGQALQDYEAGARQTLGHLMTYLGRATVEGQDLSTGAYKLRPTEVTESIHDGDVIVPVPLQGEIEEDYFPRLPDPVCSRGFMIANTNTQTLSVKEFDIVLTGFGRDNMAKVGDIWKIVRPGPERVIDGKRVQVPAKELGYLMIIKVYDRYSLGFVLDSVQNIEITDWLVRP